MASIAKRGPTKYAVICYIDGEQKWSPGLILPKAKMFKKFLDGIDDIDQFTFDTAFDILKNINNQVFQEKNVQYDEFRKMVAEKLVIPDESLNLSMSFSDFFWEFANRYGKLKWGSSYFSKCVSNMENYVFPQMGDKPIDEITVKSIDDFYTFLLTECKPVMCKYRKPLERVTPSLVLDIHKILRCMFNQAVKWEYVASNPFLKATLPEHKSKERDSLKPSELQKLLQYLDDESDFDKFVFYCAILLDFACTTRSGEILALQWQDFSAERKEVQIYKSLGRVEKDHINLPKSEIYFEFPVLYPGCKTRLVLQKTKTGHTRTSYLPTLVTEKLMTLKSIQDGFKKQLGEDYLDYGLIICQQNGRPMSSELLNKGLNMYLNEAGIKNVVFHSLRSTSATYKLKISGGDIKSVQGEGGWRDPKMVTKQYSRILEEDRRGLSEKMDKGDFFKSAAKKKSQKPRTPQMQQLMAMAETDPDMLQKLFDSLKVLT